MKRLSGAMACLVIVLGCQQSEPQGDFTGEEMTYQLHPASQYPVSGTIKFSEKKDGTTFIRITLTGTEGNLEHPVHLHHGSMSMADPEVAAILTPVLGSTGSSETHLSMLADETPVTFHDLLNMEAHVTIHLSASGEGKDIILAAGNIGTAEGEGHSHGRKKY